MRSCTISQMPKPASAPPSRATTHRTPGVGRSQPRTPATRHSAPPATRMRPFNPITPRSGCSPAYSVSHGRNAPIAIKTPPTTAAKAKRRSSLGSRRARAHIKEQVDVRQDFRGDLRAGRIGGLEGAYRGETLAGDDLVPRRGILDADDVELPPVALDLIHDVTVGRERSVFRARAEHPREIDHRWMVDAVADHRTLERRLGGPEADRRHHVEDRNAPEPGVDGPIRADLARGGGADRVPVGDGRAAKERLVIEELHRLPLQPTSREPELGVTYLVLGLLERRSHGPRVQLGRCAGVRAAGDQGRQRDAGESKTDVGAHRYLQRESAHVETGRRYTSDRPTVTSGIRPNPPFARPTIRVPGRGCSARRRPRASQRCRHGNTVGAAPGPGAAWSGTYGS